MTAVVTMVVPTAGAPFGCARDTWRPSGDLSERVPGLTVSSHPGMKAFDMRCMVLVLAILVGLSIPSLAQDEYDPFASDFGLGVPSMPAMPGAHEDFRISPPATDPLETHSDTLRPQQPPRHWRDLVDDAMRDMGRNPPGHTPESYQMMLDRQDRAMERNYYARCAKYNRWCVNMLRSLGED